MRSTISIIILSSFILFNSCRDKSSFIPFETVTFLGEDTLKISADFYRTENKQAPILLMFHQSASSRGEYANIAPNLQKRGFNCLAVDLRWGKRDFWNKVPNETGRRYGSWEVIDNYERTYEYQYEKVWPRMFASYDDILSSIDYVKREGYEGPLILWGSSFSAMFVFKAAIDRQEQVDGVVAFSPGEYYEKDTTMLINWIQQVNQPVFINAGKDTSEYLMTRPLFESLPKNEAHKFYQSSKGRHGSSVLISDDLNWKPLISFLNNYKNSIEYDYLSLAKESARWLDSVRIENKDQVWPDRVSKPNEVTLGLSQGITSKVIFNLELFEESKDSTYFHSARKGIEYQLKNLPNNVDSLTNTIWPYGLYGEVCGTGASLLRFYESSFDQEVKDGLLDMVSLIAEGASIAEDSISWGPGNDLLGGLAGTGLFLLEVGETLGQKQALKMAEKVGETLLYRAIKEETGINWYFGQDRKFILPNFSHGAAGIGFFFSKLHELTDDSRYQDAALETWKYLQSIKSDTLDGGFLLPYGVPNIGWSNAYEIGWAHGPAGTARLFQQMYSFSGDEFWLSKMKECLAAGRIGGFPKDPDQIFGSNGNAIDYRFGMAGLAHLSIDLYLITKKDEYLAYGKEIVNHIIDHARIDNRGMYWPMKLRNGEVDYFTGHFYGAAGYGRLLLKLHGAMKGDDLEYKYLDEV